MIELTQEERDLLEVGRDYKALTQMAAWPRLLDFLARWEDTALNDLRACKSSDTEVLKMLVLRWKERSSIREDLQAEVYETIEERLKWLKELSESRQFSQEAQQLIEREEIRS